MNQLQVNKVEQTLQDLIEGENFTHSQSISYLIDRLGALSVSMAFVNNQMAIAKKFLNEAKVNAYARMGITKQNLSPMLAKDFINAQCSQQQYDYDVCERTSRTIVHTIDALRTAISALKQENQYANA